MPIAGLLTPGLSDLIGMRTALMALRDRLRGWRTLRAERGWPHASTTPPVAPVTPAEPEAGGGRLERCANDLVLHLLELRPSHGRRRNAARDQGELGFDLIELGHGIRISLMPGIQKMFDAGEVTFSSLHNFCPLPVEVMHASPDCYKFSAPTQQERERAIKQTFQTIDFAERLGAPFVVLHCGDVQMNPITDELIALAKKGELLSREYVRRKIKAVQKREEGCATGRSSA